MFVIGCDSVKLVPQVFLESQQLPVRAGCRRVTTGDCSCTTAVVTDFASCGRLVRVTLL